jgi:ABC-type Fe3+-hydroxamate transport system substrate-binding protein
MTMQFQDQLGATVELAHEPQRIVSLVPSQTELLFDLGVAEKIVGVTKFCTDPADKVAAVTRVGGTKKFNFARIDALAPDLILGNKEENYQDGIEQLKMRYPVWMSDIYDLEDALSMVEQVATMVGASERGQSLSRTVRARFASLHETLGNRQVPRRAAYFIWRKPYMVVGGNNFIDHLMVRAGLCNVFGDRERYPEVTAAQVAAARPEVLLLSSEPFPFTPAHRDEFQRMVADAEVRLVDGTLFSWYGSRLLRIPAYLEAIAQVTSDVQSKGAA